MSEHFSGHTPNDNCVDVSIFQLYAMRMDRDKELPCW